MGYPDETRAMVKLTPEQQAEFIHDYPAIFAPAAGAWGRGGSTTISLPKATKAVLQPALAAAAGNALTTASKAKTKSRAKPPAKVRR